MVWGHGEERRKEDGRREGRKQTERTFPSFHPPCPTCLGGGGVRPAPVLNVLAQLRLLLQCRCELRSLEWCAHHATTPACMLLPYRLPCWHIQPHKVTYLRRQLSCLLRASRPNLSLLPPKVFMAGVVRDGRQKGREAEEYKEKNNYRHSYRQEGRMF